MVISILIAAGLVWCTYVIAKPAFLEIPIYGYAASPEGAATLDVHPFARMLVNVLSNTRQTGLARLESNVALRHATLFFFFLYFIILPGFAAEGLTIEREKDTLSALLATPFTGREIVRAKMLGAVWRLRGLLMVIVVLWLVGLACGGLHPLGFLAAILGLAVSSWFLTALGTYGSVWSKTRAEANNKIILPVLVLMLSGCLLMPIPGWSPRVWMGTASMPVIGSLSLLSYDDVRDAIQSGAFPGLTTIGIGSRESAQTVAWTWAVGLAAQAVAAFVFTRLAMKLKYPEVPPC
jgi:ABC-type Na+ efflux pump permease subunit